MRSSALVALFSGLAALVFSGGASASDIRIEIDLPETTYIRGEFEPVDGLIVNVKITNTGALPVSLTAPKLSPHSGTDFEVNLIGAPFCVPENETVAARTRIVRDPMRLPAGPQAPRPGLTLEPGRSETFQVPVGNHYRIQAGGRYEVICIHEGQRSNAATFEVMPIKSVDVPPTLLLMNIADYERGEPDYPFMFYVTASFGRFNQVVLLSRVQDRLEMQPIAEIAPGVMPQIAVEGTRVGLLVPHRNAPGVSRVFSIDMAQTAMAADIETFYHEPGTQLSLVAGGDGRFSAR